MEYLEFPESIEFKTPELPIEAQEKWINTIKTYKGESTMSKFIEINNTTINTNYIKKIEYREDHLSEKLLPAMDEECTIFGYCKIIMIDGEEILLTIDLFHLEETMSIEDWLTMNSTFIHRSMEILTENISPTKVSGFEYD